MSGFTTNPNYVIDPYGITLLHHAAGENDFARVKSLLDHGAHLNPATFGRDTPLHYLAEKNIDESHYEVAELLLKRGAVVNIQDTCFQTPIFLLVKTGNLRIVKLFLDYGAITTLKSKKNENLLFGAAQNSKNVEVLQMLIDQGLKVNCQSEEGSTPLLEACDTEGDNLKIIKCLLKHGANPSAIHQEDGTTPLTKLACNFNHSETSPEIIKKNLNFIMKYNDFNLDLQDGWSILECFARSALELSTKIILEHLAKLAALKAPVHPSILRDISEREKYSKYYKQCQDELLKAKNTKLNNSGITFYNLLVDNKKKLKNYVANKDLIKDFDKSNWVQNFPIYGASMAENLKKGIQRLKVIDKSSIVLSSCLPIFNPNHLVIKDILDYIMSKKDLQKLCENN